MPVPTRVRPEKNIWVAASDGDLVRVQELVQSGLSPNVPDPNTYTPMHAAASYGHIHVLEYLISQGGDINVTDEDGDTPIYTVENVETAQWLVEHGAVIDRTNNEGVSPHAHLVDDFPDVAAYLETTSPSATSDAPQTSNSVGTSSPTHNYVPSQHAQNIASEALTSELMEQVQEIMQRAAAEGRDPDAELRQLVGRTVLQGVATGYDMSVDPGERRDDDASHGSKRSRTDDGPR